MNRDPSPGPESSSERFGVATSESRSGCSRFFCVSVGIRSRATATPTASAAAPGATSPSATSAAALLALGELGRSKRREKARGAPGFAAADVAEAARLVGLFSEVGAEEGRAAFGLDGVVSDQIEPS